MPSALLTTLGDVRSTQATSGSAALDPDQGRWSFPTRPPAHWRKRECGHVAAVDADLASECPYCVGNAEAELLERALTVELDGLDYAMRVARNRRDARMKREAA